MYYNKFLAEPCIDVKLIARALCFDKVHRTSTRGAADAPHELGRVRWLTIELRIGEVEAGVLLLEALQYHFAAIFVRGGV